MFRSRRQFWLRLAWLCLFLFSTTKLALALPADYAALALTGQQSPSALVISTLLIAALFNPLRRCIQDFIDQRFYRQKYNAEQARAEFAAAARSETDLTRLTNKLVSLVAETIQPVHIILWAKPGSSGSKESQIQR